MSDVDITGVTMAFGPREVLRGIDLHIPAGTVTAVLGPSGCGKSTLLRILAGFESPAAGVVAVGGQTLTDGSTWVPAHRRRIGLMPQEGALFPHLSVADNVAFGLGRVSRGERAAEVTRWLAVVGLEGLEARLPHQLSGGQQQRVALARALAARPRVLLLDEPFAALDAGLRVQVREDITAILRSTTTTAILVTHDQAEALSLADRVAVLLDGSIAQHGVPHELYWRPRSLAVSRFVGSTIELGGRRHGDTVTTALGTHPVAGGDGQDAVTVVLRPEQVSITAGSTATVMGRRFYGPELTVRAQLADGSVLDIRQPGNTDAPRDGDLVGIRVHGGALVFG